MIKRVNEEDYTRIGEREEFKGLKPKDFRQMTYFNDYYADPGSNWNYYNQPPVMSTSTDRDYTQVFNNQTVMQQAKVAQKDSHNYWKRKGIPEDKEGRMMAHYFDFDQYQKQMRDATNAKKQSTKMKVFVP